MKFTLIEEERATEVDADLAGGRLRVKPDALHRAFGWTLKPQGLCKDEICVPVAGRVGLAAEAGVDVEMFADAIGRPLALDAEAGAAFLGEGAAERGQAMAGGVAPDFTLPDLGGIHHSLSDYRGRKVLMVAWASW